MKNINLDWSSLVAERLVFWIEKINPNWSNKNQSQIEKFNLEQPIWRLVFSNPD